MANILDLHHSDIERLCRHYRVRRLELFGSGTTAAFDPKRSDLDFLVDFYPTPPNLFKRYFGFKESLEALCGRDVDLVMLGAMLNSHFIASVNNTRQLVYAAENTQVA